MTFRRIVAFWAILLGSSGVSAGEDSSHGFLNLYSTQSFVSDRQTFERPRFLQGRTELMQFVGPWSLSASANYQEFSAFPWIRDDVRLNYEEGGRRWSLGDVNTANVSFQRSSMIGGLGVRHLWPRDPEKTAIRVNDNEIYLRRPAIVDIYVNGLLYSHQRRPSGALNLKEDPLLLGQSRIQVKIRDEFGVEETFPFDLMFSSHVLAEGEQQYAYEFGSPWKVIGADRLYRQEGVFSSLFHRYGITDQLMVGLNYQNWSYRTMAGAEVALKTDSGIFGLEGAISQVISVQGGAGRLTWKSPEISEGEDGGWRANANLEKAGDGFFPVTVESTAVPNYQTRADFEVARHFWTRWVATGGVTGEEAFPGLSNRQIYRLGILHLFDSQTRIELTGFRTQTNGAEDRGLLVVTWSEQPKRFSVSAFHDSQPRRSLADVRADFGNAGNLRALGLVETGQNKVELTGDGSLNFGKARLDHWMQRTPQGSNGISTLGLDTGLVWSSGNGISLAEPSVEAAN